MLCAVCVLEGGALGGRANVSGMAAFGCVLYTHTHTHTLTRLRTHICAVFSSVSLLYSCQTLQHLQRRESDMTHTHTHTHTHTATMGADCPVNSSTSTTSSPPYVPIWTSGPQHCHTHTHQKIHLSPYRQNHQTGLCGVNMEPQP